MNIRNVKIRKIDLGAPVKSLKTDLYILFFTLYLLLVTLFSVALFVIVDDVKLHLDSLIILLATLLIGAFVTFLIARRTYSKISQDIESIHNYIYNVSQKKEYDSPLEVKHYFELLEKSILLKNIVKRARQKETKLLKK